MTFAKNYQSQGVMIIRNRQHDLLLSFSHFLMDDKPDDPDHLFFTKSITVYSIHFSVRDRWSTPGPPRVRPGFTTERSIELCSQ